jgi:hypothetical protein
MDDADCACAWAATDAPRHRYTKNKIERFTAAQ